MPFSWFMELFVHTVFLDVSHAILWVKGVAMPSPFPGMDPYLETPDRWRNVHGNLATEIQTQLAPLIRPCYYADQEPRPSKLAFDP